VCACVRVRACVCTVLCGGSINRASSLGKEVRNFVNVVTDNRQPSNCANQPTAHDQHQPSLYERACDVCSPGPPCSAHGPNVATRGEVGKREGGGPNGMKPHQGMKRLQRYFSTRLPF
jgi:hypothetical protein